MAFRDRKQSKWPMYMVIFISFIMITSVIGFLYGGSGTTSVRYQGKKFVRDQKGWSTVIEGKRLRFEFLPTDLAQLNYSRNLTEKIRGKLEWDFTSSSQDPFSEDIALAQYNLGVTANSLNLFVRQGFIGNNSFGLPVISCRDGSPEVPVILMRAGNKTRAFAEGNCIVVELRSAFDAHAMKDRFLYAYLGLLE